MNRQPLMPEKTVCTAGQASSYPFRKFDWRGIAMHWLWVILIGLIVGAVAKLIMPGKDPSGFIITMLLGIAGSVVGTWIGRALGLYQEGQSAGFIMSVIGAIILLAIYHFFTRRRAAV